MRTCSLCAGDAFADDGRECPRCDGRGWLHDLEALRFEHPDEMNEIDAALLADTDVRTSGN